MKTQFILLIDFSPYSQFQLLLAQQWAARTGAELLLVHQPAVFAPALADAKARTDIAQGERKEALARLKSFAEQQLPDVQGIKYQIATEALLAYLPKLFQSRKYQLFFLGLKGTGFLKKIFMGSTATEVVDRINHVIVTLPKHPCTMSPDTFYVAVNYKFKLNTAELDKLLTLFGSMVRHVRFLTVVTKTDRAQRAAEYLEALAQQYSSIIDTSYEAFDGENAFYELKQYMNEHTDGILLIQRGPRTFTNQVFRKFLINELVYDASVPLLILPS